MHPCKSTNNQFIKQNNMSISIPPMPSPSHSHLPIVKRDCPDWLIMPPVLPIFEFDKNGIVCALLCLASFTHCYVLAAGAAKSLQSCPTLCDTIDGSPPGSSVPGILQARTLKWVAISFSNAWKWKVKVKLLSQVRLFVTPWTAAYQAPSSMGFSRQEYWSGVPLPSLSLMELLKDWLKTYRKILNGWWIIRH